MVYYCVKKRGWLRQNYVHITHWLLMPITPETWTHTHTEVAVMMSSQMNKCTFLCKHVVVFSWSDKKIGKASDVIVMTDDNKMQWHKKVRCIIQMLQDLVHFASECLHNIMLIYLVFTKLCMYITCVKLIIFCESVIVL